MILKLTNALKDTFDLTDLDSFAYEFTGLGVSMANTYADASPSLISLESKAEPKQGNLKVIFGDDGGGSAKVFAKFATFLSKPPCTITYQTEVGTYQRDFKVKEVTRSNTGKNRAIMEDITIDWLTPWYRWVTLTSKNDPIVEIEPGAYGKTYAIPQNADPPKVELIDDPAIVDFESIEVSSELRQFYSLSPRDALFERHNVLAFNGLAALQAGALFSANELTFKMAEGTEASGACKFEFWYRCDVVDNDYGEFEVTGRPYIRLDRSDITGLAKASETSTTVFLPPSTTTGWHKVVMYFESAANPMLKVLNRRQYVYFTQPSLYDVVVHSGGEGRYIYGLSYVYGDSTDTVHEQFGVFHIVNNSETIDESSSPTIVRITRGTNNPSWRVVVNNQIVQSDGYFLETLPSETLEVSSVPNSQVAQTIQMDGTTRNIYDCIDMSRTNFVMIPQGSSTLVFEGVSGDIVVDYMEVHSLV